MDIFLNSDNLPDFEDLTAQSAHATAQAGGVQVELLPPYTNRGGTSCEETIHVLRSLLLNQQLTDFGLYIQPAVIPIGLNEFSISFDWYQGSIFVPLSDLDLSTEDINFLFIELLSDEIKKIVGYEPLSLPMKALNRGYTSGIFFSDKPRSLESEMVSELSKDLKKFQRFKSSILKTSTRLCHVDFGGNPGFHCITSGYYTSTIAPIYQSLGMRPSRIDVAIDVYEPFEGSDFFLQISSLAVIFANENGLSCKPIGSWFSKKPLGRTLYLGSPKSPIQLCIYEKGIESHVDSDDLASIRPNWVRIEFRLRPDSDRRDDFKKLTPLQCLETGWIPKLLNQFGFSFEKTQTARAPKKNTPFEKSQSYLIAQYGNTLAQWFKNNPDSFCDDLLKALTNSGFLES
jgi:hypothetical protein